MRRLLFVMLVMAPWALAQTGASVRVRLIPLDGGIVERASVLLSPVNRRVIASRAATADFTELPPGSYWISILAEGYEPIDTAVTVEAGEAYYLEARLHRLALRMPEEIVEARGFGRDTKVFARSEIEQSAVHTLDEFLRAVAGVGVVSDGGAANSIRIGGSATNQVLVLLDGRRVQDLGRGEADLSSIPLEWIESVEIVRGGKSSLGGEAIGGVLNIKTLVPAERRELSLGRENHATYNRTSFVGGGHFGTVASLVSMVRTQGPKDFRYTITEDDGVGEFTHDLGKSFRRQNNDILRDQLLVKLTGGIGNGGSGEVSGTLDRSSRGMPSYLAPQRIPFARLDAQEESLNLRLGWQNPRRSAEGRVAYDHRSSYYRHGLPANMAELGSRWEGEIRGNANTKQGQFSAGGRVEKEWLQSRQVIGGVGERDRSALWSEGNHGIVELLNRSVTLRGLASVRWERFGRNGAVLPKFGAGLEHAGSLSWGAFATWGRSYRAPTLYSLFWVDDAVTVGNPDLEAETSREYVARFWAETSAMRRTRLDVEVSDQNIENLISWRRTFDNRWKPFNLARARLRTLDVAIEQRLWKEGLRVTGGTNWTEAKDATNDRNTGGKYLTFRPPRSHRVGLACQWGRASADANFRWVSERPALETNSKWLRAYEIVDLRLTYRVSVRQLGIATTLGVENLFDEDYRLVRFAPMPGRDVFISVNLTERAN